MGFQDGFIEGYVTGDADSKLRWLSYGMGLGIVLTGLAWYLA